MTQQRGSQQDMQQSSWPAATDRAEQIASEIAAAYGVSGQAVSSADEGPHSTLLPASSERGGPPVTQRASYRQGGRPQHVISAETGGRGHGADQGEETSNESELRDYNLNRVLKAARAKFSNEIPDFCFRNQGRSYVVVDIGNDERTDILFQKWDSKSMYGFWTYEIRSGQKVIVKYFPADKHYRAYLGPDVGYGKEPIAWRKENSPGAIQRRQRPATYAESPTEASDDHVDATDSHALRKRRRAQMMPYQSDKVKHNYARAKGKPMASSDLERELSQRQGDPDRKVARRQSVSSTASKEKALAQSHHTSRVSRDVSKLSESGTPTRDSSGNLEARIRAHTTIRTRLHGAACPLIPHYFKNCDTIEKFLTNITDSWKFMLKNHEPEYMVIHFPWRDKESNILIRAGLHDSFDKMTEEIREAPCWEAGGRCDIDVTLFTS